MTSSLFSSESVSSGHPDKVADRISDEILDACLEIDPDAVVACETLVTKGLIVISGEINVRGTIDYRDIALRTIADIGYNDPGSQFNSQTCRVITEINRQSKDISFGLDHAKKQFKELGAGDQGTMFGFACDETPELMPLPIMLAHGIIREIRLARQKGVLPYLRPDAKSQVTVEYDESGKPFRLHTAVVSTQHTEGIEIRSIERDIKMIIRKIVPADFIDPETVFYINPLGRFVTGGPEADCGLTGRKIIVDTYGGMGRHGGGAFSGKDPSKPDRSAAYAARYIAKNIVAARLAKRCEVQLSYAIGIPDPIAFQINTFGTSSVGDEILTRSVPLVFALTLKGIIEMLDLRRPVYRKTSCEGHFGREESDFTWERIDRVQALSEAVRSLS